MKVIKLLYLRVPSRQSEKGMKFKMKILLVEDNEMIAKGLKYSLEQKGYEFFHTVSIRETLEFIKSNQIDLIILDITLPDGNGFDLYEENIKNKNIPTIFLTARDEEDYIVKGLEIGAEDYITKPFSTRELIARINKVLSKTKKNKIVIVKDIIFDMDKMVVYKKRQSLGNKDKNEYENQQIIDMQANDKMERVDLTSLELKIFYMLFSNLNKVVTRNDIIDKIWEWTGNDVNDNTVTVYLKRIREKINSDIIITIKGIGYRIDEE